MEMKRTQEEIKARFEEADDWMGIQKNDLISYMDFETAKPLLDGEYVKAIEDGTEKWEDKVDLKERIKSYMDFAVDKAENQRGLSAGRSMLHYKTWIWLDDPSFYDEIVWEIDNYTDYGKPVLEKICKHYGIDLTTQ
jgi:hypothetical protein